MPAKPVVDYLGQPCRAKNILSTQLVADPKTGKEWFVLCNSSETTHIELIFIDFEANTGQVYTAPTSEGAWAMRLVLGNRLVIGTYYDGHFLVFDLNNMQFSKAIKVPESDYFWNFTVGKDGRIYGGTYPNAKLAALNLDTYEVETFDSPTVKENMYLRHVFPTADGRVICVYTLKDLVTHIFDPKTKQFTLAPKELYELNSAVIWEGYLCTGNKVYDGITLSPIESIPFPEPPEQNLDWAVLPNLTTVTTLYLRQGQKIYRFEKKYTELRMVTELDSRLGGMIRGISRTGKFIGTIGQKYFVVTPGKKEAEIRPYPVETAGRPTMFLKSDDKGRIWGGPEIGQTLFWVDTKTKQYVNTDVVSSMGGEVYNIVFYCGKVYAAAYSGGEIIEFDPEKPFDLLDGNPKPILHLAPEYIRPLAGICIGENDHLYAGWMAKYGKYGGVISITDLNTEKSELIKDPFCQQGISGLAVGENKLFIGTTLAGNGLPNNPIGKPVFGIMDLNSRKILYKFEFDAKDIISINNLGYDAKSQTVIMAANKQIYLFDISKMSFRKIDDTLPKVNNAIAVLGDGFAYYGNDTNLIKFDLIQGKVIESIPVSMKISKIAIDKDKTIYFTSGSSLYRIS